MTLPAYPAYRPTGVQWLGRVPSHWDVLPLKRISQLVTERAEQATRPIALEHIESWTGRLRPADNLFESDGVVFKPGDILFGKLRPYLAKVYLSDDAGEAVGDFFVVRPGRISAPFLHRYLLNPVVIQEINASTIGAKMPRASWEDMGALPVTVPSKDEQTLIINFLDHETAKIDVLVEEQKRLIELLKEKHRAAISRAVTKGLDPNAPMKDSGVKWLGEVPAHWSVSRIKHAAKLESGHTPRKDIAAYWDQGDIPWVSLNDSKALAANDYIAETKFSVTREGIAGSSARILPPEAVVFTRDATIGLCAITRKEMAVSQHLIAWICGPDLVPEFLLHVFYAMQEELERMTFGATIKTIGMPDIRSLCMPMPPLTEQQSIVAHLSEKRLRLNFQVQHPTEGKVLRWERTISI